MTIKVQLSADIIHADQFGCFVKGGAALDIGAQSKKSGAWMNDTAWLNAMQLSISDSLFKELPEAILRGDKQWKEWMEKDAPEAERVPDFEDRLDKFHRMHCHPCTAPGQDNGCDKRVHRGRYGCAIRCFPALVSSS